MDKAIQIEEKETVGSIAVRSNRARKALEDLGIDYCCGGNISLAEAARKAGIKQYELVDRLAVELAKSEAADAEEREWTVAPPEDLIEYVLSAHHAYMKTVLPRIKSLLERVLRAHGPAHGDVLTPLDRIFRRLSAEITEHLYKEEEILFPLMRREAEAAHSGKARPFCPCGTVANPIRQMQFEHDNAGEALRRMRDITHGYALPPDACPSFKALYDELQAMEKDLHEHIHLENNILFPRAERLEETFSGR
ncbi:MAG TPA: iron-sulfur cluster repair di-iron protein [Candidatus Brocadiia bacterium]|nr:iron-sulfur cluster repair di-iron protein [Candidatus Brocadiia bacterium]